MPTVAYELLDVFTSTPFTGNPLAVVIDPPPLTDEQRQQIANELHLSETVFLTETDAGWVTRIFTPVHELPFAGHPTVGAALALARAGRVDGSATLLEGVGPVNVVIDGGTATLRTAMPPTSVECADPDDVVGALGLTLGDLHPGLGPRAWSAGVPFTMVALRDVETLGRIEVDVTRWHEGVGRTAAGGLYALTPVDGDERSGRWRARMVAPGLGIPEDPATGSAAAAACGYLAGHAPTHRLESGWIIEQGVEMGRPSTLRVGAVFRGNELVAATVGGEAVHVGRGELHLP